MTRTWPIGSTGSVGWSSSSETLVMDPPGVATRTGRTARQRIGASAGALPPTFVPDQRILTKFLSPKSFGGGVSFVALLGRSDDHGHRMDGAGQVQRG